jgi:murein DD-endopeptidase MepM/ murein hydrolase activator NlpD
MMKKMFKMILEDYFDELSEEELVAVNGGACTGGGCTGMSNSSFSSGSSNSGFGSGSGTITLSAGGCMGNSLDASALNSTEEAAKVDSGETTKLAEVKYGWAWCLGEKYSDENYMTDDYGNTIDRADLINDHTELSIFHHGIDLKANKGERINAMMDGIVTEVGNSDQLGNYVTIKLSDGSDSSVKYAHCDSVIVSVGQSVLAGQKVATVGMTGVSTGYHLHIAYDGDNDGNFNSESSFDNPAHILFPGSL